MFPRTDSVLKKIPKIDLLRKEVITWNAINQATAEGLAPTNLAELVPTYLVNIPVSPIDKKPFVFDSKNRTLNKTEWISVLFFTLYVNMTVTFAWDDLSKALSFECFS